MGEFRYPQFCVFARAAEVLGHRWTLLILRNLMAAGPQRFSDLRRGLAGISASVLSQRLADLEARGVVRRRSLPPPAAATVYELDEAGRALAPAMMELARWGLRFLGPPEPGDQIEPGWVRGALVLFKRWEPTPPVAVEIHLTDDAGGEAVAVEVRGGPDGTSVENVLSGEAHAVLRAAPADLMGVLLGHLPLAGAVAEGRLRVSGDRRAAERLPELFDLDRGGLPRTEAPATGPQGP